MQFLLKGKGNTHNKPERFCDIYITYVKAINVTSTNIISANEFATQFYFFLQLCRFSTCSYQFKYREKVFWIEKWLILTSWSPKGKSLILILFFIIPNILHVYLMLVFFLFYFVLANEKELFLLYSKIKTIHFTPMRSHNLILVPVCPKPFGQRIFCTMFFDGRNFISAFVQDAKSR